MDLFEKERKGKKRKEKEIEDGRKEWKKIECFRSYLLYINSINLEANRMFFE